MRIKVLAENTAVSDEIKCEHGLSIYVETESHKLLFDTGATNLFAVNAGKMGVDISEVDTVVISHGHHDHGGGLETFFKLNSQAKVYLRDNAFTVHYAKRPDGDISDVGLKQSLQSHEQLVMVGHKMIIDGELSLFSNVKGGKFNPSGNIDLLMKLDEVFVRDDFSHEQNLLIKESGKTVLVAGCAHCGIVNILDQCSFDNGFLPDVVIGGFHLYNPLSKKSEEPEVIEKIGRDLLETGTMFYTGHCTGHDAYKQLKAIMGGRIQYLSGGSDITI